MALSAVSIAPNNPSIACGEILLFTATPVGGTPSAYQWNVDSSNVGGADQSTYAFNSSNWTLGSHTIKCYALNGSNPVSETETIVVYSLYTLLSQLHTDLATTYGHLAIIRKAVE
jgi:hypothetical protein